MKILITGGSGFIGTNSVRSFLNKGHQVLNVDVAAPLDPSLTGHWHRVDIMDANALGSAFRNFQPDAVIHLAARTECDETTTVEKGYAMNTEGTAKVLHAIQATPSVQRAIIVSSQFVCGPNHPPAHDEDFHPVTVYGQSKVLTEQLTRQASLKCCWTIVRPTNIWGPWHQRYRREFWKIAAKGLYVHPGGKPVMRCYGYVGNFVYHLHALLKANRDTVNRQVLYLSDPPEDIYRWANAFCRALHGSPARRMPRPLLKLMGVAGDAITHITGKPFYITSGRVNSMTSDYLVPHGVEKTIATLGLPPYSLEDGVRATLDWLETANDWKQ